MNTSRYRERRWGDRREKSAGAGNCKVCGRPLTSVFMHNTCIKTLKARGAAKPEGPEEAKD